MELLSEKRLNSIAKNNNNEQKIGHAIYQIIQFVPDTECYQIKNLKTREIIELELPRIFLSQEIIEGLAPNQACWLGIEFGEFLFKSIRTQENYFQMLSRNFNLMIPDSSLSHFSLIMLFTLNIKNICFIKDENFQHVNLQHRYGQYILKGMSRKQLVLFQHHDSMDTCMIDLSVLVFSPSLIERFDATEAYYIGMWWAWLKLRSD